MESIHQTMGRENMESKTNKEIPHEERMAIIHETMGVIKKGAIERFSRINGNLSEIKRLLLEKTSSTGNKLREQDVNAVIFIELERIRGELESFESVLEPQQ